MATPVIVIPIYKTKLSENEVLSLKQCFKILGKYPIIFVCADSLNTNFYEEACKSAGITFKVKKFEDKFFESTHSYSRLLLDKIFYKAFEEYEYMLIYQLDAWVFEDRLQEWCEKGYDYIGAPWFHGYSVAKIDAPMYEYAGNGGFSLRNISKFIDILVRAENSNLKIRSFLQVHTKDGRYSPLNIFRLPKTIIRYKDNKNSLKHGLKITNDAEDNVIVTNLRRNFPELKISKAADAKYFSFEVLPSRLYKECGNKLPFGCHAWEKFEPEFWANFIN